MKTKTFALALLCIFATLTFSSSLKNSGTCDEIAHHIPVGYVLLTKWDFKMDTSQPPLSRYIIAMPIRLFMNVKMPNNMNDWRRDDRSSFGRDFIYKYNKDPKKMILLCRIPIIIIGILCGLLLFIWSRSLYGNGAGLLSLFLYCFSPDIIAHSGLATTDMVGTFFILLSLYSFWLFMKCPSYWKAIASGVCLGLAQLSKYNAILLYPIFVLSVFLPLLEKESRNSAAVIMKLIGIIIVSLIVVWAGYGFDRQPILKDAMRVEEKIDSIHNILSKLPFRIDSAKVDKFLKETPVPLGSHALGVMGVAKRGRNDSSTYFFGRWSGRGNPLYFIVAFLIKNPIPLFIFMIMGLHAMFIRRISTAEKLILITIALYMLVASLGNLQIGIRHILPIFPLCFIIAGRSEALIKRNFIGFISWFLIAWYAVSALMAWPHYLGYFNEFVGGSKNGYKYLRDSNADWGQDLPALADYMRKSGKDKIILDYFGQADPRSYGINYRELSLDEMNNPHNGVYAISIQNLDNVSWTRKYKPDALAGYSIFIYDFTGRNVI